MYHNVYKSMDNVLYGLHVYWDFHSSINDIDNSVRQGDCYNTPINCVPRTQQVPQVCPTEVLVVTQAILCHLGYPKVSQHMLKIPTVINYVTISEWQFIWLEPGVREMADEGDSFCLLGYSTLLDTGTLWGRSFSGIMSTCITINSTNLLGEQRFTKGYLQNCVPLTSATEEKK